MRWLRALWAHLKGEHASSGRLALAVGVGLFVGTLPFYGLHLFICLACAWLIGLNKVTTYLAANISNPLISPFLAFGSVQIGERLMRGTFLELSVEGLERAGPARFFESWLLGGVVLGAALGVVGGLVTYLGTTRRRRRERATRQADVFVQLSALAADRYRPAGRFAHGYVRRKLVLDPVYRALFDRIAAPADVLDLGCGRGQTAVLLALRSGSGPVTGVDWDERKIAIARRAADGLEQLRFEVHDLRTPCVQRPSSAVLLIDVLHYLPEQAQLSLLGQAERAVAPGGTLYLRDVDAAAGWRYVVTWLEERIFTGLRFNRGAILHFRPIAEVVERLQAAGLSCSVEPMWQGTPFANVLVVGYRPRDSRTEAPKTP